MSKFYFSILKCLVIVFLVIVTGFLYCESRENSSLRSQIRDLEVQLAQSIQKADTFFIRDSIPVWKERVVEVDRTDYKKQLADRQLIKDLNLKVAQVEAENRLLRSTRDTVILTPVNDSTLRYADKWVSFEYMTRNQSLSYAVRDSLTTLVTRQYKHRFLWWRWGTKGYDLYVVSHNPKCKVEYNKFIKIK